MIYHFDIVNGHRLADPAGIDLKSDQDAERQAKIIAAQIAVEVPTSAAHRHISVRDDNGRVVAKVRVKDAN